jgi:hypothetical protein
MVGNPTPWTRTRRLPSLSTLLIRSTVSTTSSMDLPVNSSPRT